MQEFLSQLDRDLATIKRCLVVCIIAQGLTLGLVLAPIVKRFF